MEWSDENFFVPEIRLEIFGLPPVKKICSRVINYKHWFIGVTPMSKKTYAQSMCRFLSRIIDYIGQAKKNRDFFDNAQQTKSFNQYEAKFIAADFFICVSFKIFFQSEIPVSMYAGSPQITVLIGTVASRDVNVPIYFSLL
jgi:hypothetical protein